MNKLFTEYLKGGYDDICDFPRIAVHASKVWIISNEPIIN